ncbi:MAG TPA: NUDIX hydrolase [Acidimicrobiia bacterium]|jgi:8-oxo-dGTP diphosphatase|nr:NUDIX hydrolase [Acidimicrobiia bacterium]
MAVNDDQVQAAGGVVARSTPDGAVEYLVVHRPQYDDWSLPKGKLEPGESLEDAARREVEEETGVRVTLGPVLPTCEYVDRHGRPKIVHYWRMTPVGRNAWEPNDEVDETRWITAAQAATLLSYDHDRRLVATVDGASHGGSA